MPDAAGAARRPALAVLGVLLWLVATVLVAAAPLLYFVAGASDDASDADRMILASFRSRLPGRCWRRR